jgi:hypothetical protein
LTWLLIHKFLLNRYIWSTERATDIIRNKKKLCYICIYIHMNRLVFLFFSFTFQDRLGLFFYRGKL